MGKIIFIILVSILLLTGLCSCGRSGLLVWDDLPPPIYEVVYGDGHIGERIYVTDGSYEKIIVDNVVLVTASDYYSWVSLNGEYNPTNKEWPHTYFTHIDNSVTVCDVTVIRQLK